MVSYEEQNEEENNNVKQNENKLYNAKNHVSICNINPFNLCLNLWGPLWRLVDTIIMKLVWQIASIILMMFSYQ